MRLGHCLKSINSRLLGGHAAAILVVIIGFALVVQAFQFNREIRLRKAADEVDNRVDFLMNLIERHRARTIESLTWLQRFAYFQNDPTAAKIKEVSAALLGGRKELEVIAVVDLEHISATTERAQSPETRVPIQYVLNTDPAGLKNVLDLKSAPELTSLFARVLESQAWQVTDPTRTGSGTKAASKVSVGIPLNRTLSTDSGGSSGIGANRALWVQIDIKEWFDRALASARPRDLDLAVLKPGGDADRLLYFRPSPSRDTEFAYPGEDSLRSGIFRERTLSLGADGLLLLFSPASHHLAPGPVTPGDWAIPLAALSITALLVAYMVMTRRRASLIESTIGTRTAELIESNRKLEQTVRVSRDQEKRLKLFFQLAEALTATHDVHTASKQIANSINKILEYDAFSVDTYARETDSIHSVLTMDTINGETKEVPPAYDDRSPSPMARRILEAGPQLILRNGSGPKPDELPLNPFGDAARPSSSLMFAPIRRSADVFGLLSMQSYRQNAYNNEDLEVLQALGDLAGGTFERLRAEEDRRNIERKMQESQKLESLGVMAGGIAHDFNNLLTGIMCNVTLVRGTIQNQSDIDQCMEQAEIACHRAASLCKQMLTYSGRGQYQTQEFNLNALVRETAELASASIDKRISIELELPSGDLLSRGDPSQIRQVVLNLLINAAEAIENRPGTITARAGSIRVDQGAPRPLVPSLELKEGDYVFLEVQDNGTGMKPEILRRIFDPFFTTKFTGRGLGLAATIGILRAHNGGILVDSAPEKGSTFTMLLPAVNSRTVEALNGKSADPPHPDTDNPAPGAEGMDDGQSGDATGDRHSILIVDDEDTVRKVIGRVVASMNYDIYLAASGPEALRIFQANRDRIDLVLLDLTMPEMDGHETLVSLRRIEPKIAIVLMSGYSESKALTGFEGDRLSAFIHKPFTKTDLAGLIKKLLPHRSSHSN